MRKCPYCAEMIQDDALICRYCGKDQPGGTPEQVLRTTPLASQTKPSLAIPILSLVMAIVALPFFVITFLLAFAIVDYHGLQSSVVDFGGTLLAYFLNIPLLLAFFFSILTLVRNNRLQTNRGNVAAIIALIISILDVLVVFVIVLGLANI